MFGGLSKSLTKVFDSLRGKSAINEADFNDAMRGIRVALLESDVPLSVITYITKEVKSAAIGSNVLQEVSASHMIVKIVHDTIVRTLGGDPNAKKEANHTIDVLAEKPHIMVMIGLQGSGKTTTTAKIGYRHAKKCNKKVLLASLDVHRPAAAEQLATMGRNAGVDVLEIQDGELALDITKRALRKAGDYDVLILDTAGRTSINVAMMEELRAICRLSAPHEILCVVDSSIGQSAYSVVKTFDESVGITGVVLTKTDSDAAGGSALAMFHIVGKPVKMIGTGEKIQDLEAFDPNRMADRILGMGDIVSLVEKASENVSESEVQKIGDKIKKGKFDLNDYAVQLRVLSKMGGLAGVMSFLPVGGLGAAAKSISSNNGGGLDGDNLKTSLALLSSMTKDERENPQIIVESNSRKVRIASGAGARISDLGKLLKQFSQIAGAVKMLSGLNLDNISSNSDLLGVIKKLK